MPIATYETLFLLDSTKVSSDAEAVKTQLHHILERHEIAEEVICLIAAAGRAVDVERIRERAVGGGRINGGVHRAPVVVRGGGGVAEERILRVNAGRGRGIIGPGPRRETRAHGSSG